MAVLSVQVPFLERTALEPLGRGKVRLHQGRDEEALWALQSVVALEGPHASEARRLLDYLQQEQQREAAE